MYIHRARVVKGQRARSRLPCPTRSFQVDKLFWRCFWMTATWRNKREEASGWYNGYDEDQSWRDVSGHLAWQQDLKAACMTWNHRVDMRWMVRRGAFFARVHVQINSSFPLDVLWPYSLMIGSIAEGNLCGRAFIGGARQLLVLWTHHEWYLNNIREIVLDNSKSLWRVMTTDARYLLILLYVWLDLNSYERLVDVSYPLNPTPVCRIITLLNLHE